MFFIFFVTYTNTTKSSNFTLDTLILHVLLQFIPNSCDWRVPFKDMMLYLFFCSIFCYILPLVYSGNVTLPIQIINSNSSVNSDSTKLALPSEGGTVFGSTPNLSLPKDKQLANLLELDEELGRHESKSIKPRKGADNPNNRVVLKTATELQNSTVSPKLGNAKNKSHLLISKIIANVNGESKNTTISKNITEAPKKPLILSYESLVNADKIIKNDEIKIPASNPSSNTLPNLAISKIHSPNKDATLKVYPSKANSHPEMIMPIVITILVVPMFAIVGYLAVRRGQEAWKNRHYKRMDFLLDGMYND